MAIIHLGYNNGILGGCSVHCTKNGKLFVKKSQELKDRPGVLGSTFYAGLPL
jgi:hypothetical protein